MKIKKISLFGIIKFFNTKLIQISAVLVLIVFVTGIIGFRLDGASFAESVYRIFQLFLLESIDMNSSNPYFEAARYTAALVTGFAILKLIFFLAKDQIDEIDMKRFSNHYIICGLSWKSKKLLDNLVEAGERVIIVEKNSEHDDISEYIFRRNVKLIIGDAQDEYLLKKLNISKASYIYAFTEDDQVNLKIYDSIRKICDTGLSDNKGSKLKVRIHLKGIDNLMLFKEFHKPGENCIDFHAFNIYKLAAQNIVDEFSPDRFLDIREDSEPVHILISGLGEQGAAVLYEAALMYHFENLQKLKVSIVDDAVSSKIEIFKSKFPNIDKVIDIHEIELSQLKIKTLEIEDVSVCFVSHQEDSVSLEMCNVYRQIFFDIHQSFKITPIVAILTQNTSLADLLPAIMDKAGSINVVLKDLYSDFCTKSAIVDNCVRNDDIARYIHVIYKDSEGAKESIKYLDIKHWGNMTDFEKDWNRLPARHLDIKLRAVGFELSTGADGSHSLADLSEDQKRSLARMEKKRWNAEKWLTGFTSGKKYKGEDKTPKSRLKYHPLLIEWDELSDEDKSKDSYTIDNIQLILDRLNMKLLPAKKYE